MIVYVHPIDDEDNHYEGPDPQRWEVWVQDDDVFPIDQWEAHFETEQGAWLYANALAKHLRTAVEDY